MFVVYYISGLDTRNVEQIVSSKSAMGTSGSEDNDERDATFPIEHTDRLKILLCGYSYGSMITQYIPPIKVLLELFANPEQGTTIAGILDKATELSALRNMQVQSLERRSNLSSSQSSDSIFYESSYILSMGGGSEMGTGKRARASTCTRENFEKGRELSRKKIRMRFRHRRNSRPQSQSSLKTRQAQAYPSDATVLAPAVSYFLISPILPPISSFATMSFFSSNEDTETVVDGKAVSYGNPEEQLTTHKTLAVYGNSDIFTSIKKLRKWSLELLEKQHPFSQFEFKEIENAGHFWHEAGTARELRRIVRNYGISIGTDET